MRKLPPVALVAAGKLTHSFLLDLPGFRERIGPIHSATLRVASRLSNTLHAGVPAVDFRPFEDCPLALICVPEEAVETAVFDMAQSGIDWSRRSILLADTRLTSRALAPLSEQGAFVASVDRLPGRARMLLAEGDRETLPELRRLTGRAGRVVRIATERKALYGRALAIASLCGPLAALAGEQLREAGLAPAQARPVVESILLDAVRSYVKSGRNVLKGGDIADRKVFRALMDAAEAKANARRK